MELQRGKVVLAEMCGCTGGDRQDILLLLGQRYEQWKYLNEMYQRHFSVYMGGTILGRICGRYLGRFASSTCPDLPVVFGRVYPRYLARNTGGTCLDLLLILVRIYHWYLARHTGLPVLIVRIYH